MNAFTNLSPQQLRQAADIQEQILSLQDQLQNLLGVSSPVLPTPPATSSGRRMSRAGRARISAAARARWAKHRAAAAAAAVGSGVKAKGKFSDAAKAKLAAIARARWKKAKAQGKSRL
jgi:hypothetical protein